MPERTQDGDVVYPESETVFANNIKRIKELGVEIIGGCCGTTPAYIQRVKEFLAIEGSFHWHVWKKHVIWGYWFFVAYTKQSLNPTH